MNTLMTVSRSRSIGSKLLFNQAFSYVTPKQWKSSKAIFQPKTPNAINRKTTVDNPKMFGVRVPPKFNSYRFNIQQNLKIFHVSDGGNKAKCDIINIGSAKKTHESGVINNTSHNDNSQLGESLNKGKLSAGPCNKITKPSKPNDCSSTVELKKVLSKGVADSICYKLNDVPLPKTLENAVSPVSACNKNLQESASQKSKSIEKKNNSTVNAMPGTKKTEKINDNSVALKLCEIFNNRIQTQEKVLKLEQITIPSAKKIVRPESELKSTQFPKRSDVKENKKNNFPTISRTIINKSNSDKDKTT